jgi:D-alanyl-D-alanine carboxypeptidase/D-alanyl-D-alanine-endopeptidase (penicillin-binding protein 4)
VTDAQQFPAPSGQGPNGRGGNRVGIVAAVLAVVFILLAVGAVFAGIAVGKPASGSTPSGSSSSGPTRAVATDQVAPAAIPTCSIKTLATSSKLGTLYGSVVDATGSASRYDAHGSDAQTPAAGEKVLTAAAALAVLGPEYRITTQVVDGVTPGSITLVGAGDATLSALPAGQSVYKGAPTMASLAAQTLTAYNTAHPGVPITQVVLDASYWDPSDNWDSSWDRSQQTGGHLSEITALQVDGDRANPRLKTSPRGDDPVTHAGEAFVAALGLTGVDLIPGTAENGAPQLAKVESQPMRSLVSQMLFDNDNTMAEMLARIVSVKESLGGTSSSLAQAIPQALGKYNIDTGELTIVDGSGISAGDTVPPVYLARLMAAVSQQKNDLKYVGSGLPVAGTSGSLATRFTGTNAVAKGAVSAKPGSSPNSYTLSGYLTAKDGTKLAFAFFAEGSGLTDATQSALDSLTAGVYSCGKNLTTH